MVIFSKSFLHNYLAEYRASEIVGLRTKKKLISKWIDFLTSGRAEQGKEEDHKSRFISDIFGEVLGFSHSNNGKWLMQEELKTHVDGTKPDAAFGFFTLESGKLLSDVRMVIEFKKSKTPLEKEQSNRIKKYSPLDQAFLYASKMTGNCNWVVVCNLDEIRFYHYSTQQQYQSYFLKDLTDENILKELIYLFHADHLIRKDISFTDRLYSKSKLDTKETFVRKQHIIDELYGMIKKFDGISFVDPDYIANLYPFNILGEHVWHYSYYRLTTLNPKIHQLLSGINLKDKKIELSAKLKQDLEEKGVIDYEFKLGFIFQRLNDFLILGITAVEDYQAIAITKQNVLGYNIRYAGAFPKENHLLLDIQVTKQFKCDCILCLYRRFEFNTLIEKTAKLVQNEGGAEASYALYLTGSHNQLQTYHALKKHERSVKGKDNKLPEYFINKLNQINGYNLLTSLASSGSKEARETIRTIDLDTVIANEVEVYADKDLRAYLIRLKDEKLIRKISSEIKDILKSTEEILRIFSNGGSYAGSDHMQKLKHLQMILYYHLQKNYLMLDSYEDYRTMSADIFQSYLHSYQTPFYGLTKFGKFELMEAVINIAPTVLEKMLKTAEKLKTTEGARREVLLCASNLLGSYFSQGTWGNYKNELMTAQLTNHRFKTTFDNLFSNIFTVINSIDYTTAELEDIVEKSVKFIEIEDFMSGHALKRYTCFIETNSQAYTIAQLKRLLTLAIKKHSTGNWKYDSMFISVCNPWLKEFPENKFDSTKLIQMAILNSGDEYHTDFLAILPLWKIADDKCRNILLSQLEAYLNDHFNQTLYHELLHEEIFTYKRGNFFEKLAIEVNNQMSTGDFYEDLGQMFPDFTLLNFAIIIHRFKIDPQLHALPHLKKMTPYRHWLMDPDNFDYSKFDIQWLKWADNDFILERMNGIQPILDIVLKELKKTYDPILSEIYIKLIA